MNKKNINKLGFDNWMVENLKNDPKIVKKYVKESIKNFDEDGDIELLLSSLRHAASAKGWTYLEKQTGISRQALYTALSKNGNPRIKTFMTILGSLGYSLKLV